MMTRQKGFSLPAATAASAATPSGRQRRLAMTDVTNVLLAGMTPPDIIRRVKATDDFAPDIIHTATTKSCSLTSSHPTTTVGQESPGNRSHRRSETFFDWDDPIISTTQSYTSYDENIDNAPTPTRRFEYIHLNTFCGQRQSRSSALTYHATLHTKDDPSSSDVSSNKLNSSLQYHKCNQKSRDSTTAAKSSSCIPSNISELISNLNAKAKLLADEYDDEDDASSLDFDYSDSSSDDSMIEDVIYKSVGPIPLSSSKQQCHQLKEQTASSKNDINIKKGEEGSSSTMKDLICAICLDFPDDPKHIATVSGCTHRFCFQCIEKWAQKGSNECPLCKSSFHLIASGNRVRWY